jgi:hypothetical protein
MNNYKIKPTYIIIFSILFFLFSYPFIFIPFGNDQAIFAYIGKIINNGAMPYRDAWDLKPPVIYYLYSLGLKIFGSSMMSLRIFDFAYFSSTLFAIYLLGSLLFNKRVGVCSGLMLGILYFFTNDFWALSQCESFMILPMILSVYLCCAGLKKYNWPMLFGSGVLLSVVFMTKLTGIILFVPIVLYILFETYSQRGTWDIVHISSRILILIAGFFITTAIFFLWFYMRGALSDLIYTLFVYDAAHFRSALKLNTGYAHLSSAGFMRRYLFLLIPTLLSLLIKTNRQMRSENVLLYCWVFAAICAFFVQARYFHYHMLPVIAPLALLGSQGFLSLWSYHALSKTVLSVKIKAVFIAVITLFLFIAIYPHLRLTYNFTKVFYYGKGTKELNDRFFTGQDGFSLSTITKAAQYIKNNSAKENSIYVWGFQPLLYFLSERQAPTRFFFSAPLIAPFNKKKNEWREEFLADLKRKPPYYIIVAEDDTLVNTLMSGVNKDSRTMLGEFPELLMLLKKQYVIDQTIDNLLLYHYTGE